MPYRLVVRHAREGAIDRLIELGAVDVEAEGERLVALMPDRIAPAEIEDALGVAVSTSPARGRDAESVWVLRPRRVRVGQLEVAPADVATARGRVRLVDAPAFGTGMHPTTRLCLASLQELVEIDRPDRVLDVGTGSGVLALAALALGVRHATATDIDDDALSVAAENARINGVSSRLDLRRGGPESVDGAWPLVLSNIIAAVLIDMAPLLTRRVAHHGRCVLSGIASSVTVDVQRAYGALGMRLLSTQSQGGWTALVMQATW